MIPKRYRALHITPGVVDYPEEREMVLIRKKALDKMNASFLGKPVFNFVHKPEISPLDAFNFTDEEKEKHADGVISGVGYDVETGYYWVDMMIWDKETQDNIDNGYSVSNAYVPEVDKSGGVHNSVNYDVEVVDGEYHHMAVVKDPRYGDARIFENSKKSKTMKWKIFSKKKGDVKQNASDPPPADDKKEEEEMEVNSDSVIEVDGEKIPLAEMINSYKSSMAPDKKEEDESPTMNMEDTIDIDGKEVSMKELYDNYCAKKNAEPPTDKPLEDVVKQNSADEKEPNDNFLKLKTNANRGAEPEKIKINTQRDRLSRGKTLYGSAPVQVQAQGGN